MRRLARFLPKRRRSWFLGLMLLSAGCTAAGPHAKAIKAVDEDEVIAAAEKDSFPSAQSPAN